MSKTPWSKRIPTALCVLLSLAPSGSALAYGPGDCAPPSPLPQSPVDPALGPAIGQYQTQACQEDRQRLTVSYQRLHDGPTGRLARAIDQATRDIDREWKRHENRIKQVGGQFGSMLSEFQKSSAGLEIRARAYDLGLADMKRSGNALANEINAHADGPLPSCPPLTVQLDNGSYRTVERVPDLQNGHRDCVWNEKVTEKVKGVWKTHYRIHRDERSTPAEDTVGVRVKVGADAVQGAYLPRQGVALPISQVVVASDRYDQPSDVLPYAEVDPDSHGSCVLEGEGRSPVGGIGSVLQTSRDGTYEDIWRNCAKGSSTPYMGYCQKSLIDAEAHKNSWGDPGFPEGFWGKDCSGSAHLLKAPTVALEECIAVAETQTSEDTYSDHNQQTFAVCVQRDVLSGATRITGRGNDPAVEDFRNRYSTLDLYLADHLDAACGGKNHRM
ncbi:MAG TPA: hypothetical protein VL588_12330 [Bdellovibrionota bacterium]|jgi:hypothetical protein|nr:hypothetical protein [Bdellovibrionota bacterium]